mmetsp:Transcript_22070/g.45941  ORF Transcript_22070/g.45941 Transcript_22070/m.45941 type:complete len:275 (-) Transcript_22070:243-1067(-)|eukprot:CAMPEP_0182537200 /NCGR_PEP_ID=MMETSP1323-20130603/21534_1 /TAXON_ID=236787 /ORGANISM="Florenciella parvula, Strain RCC1693" /LENGTH=274 /DNA_ID=CAMNT_0024747549 /DNA_START=84 /DNA_END=908 /DNA_ORIENTATION=-
MHLSNFAVASGLLAGAAAWYIYKQRPKPKSKQYPKILLLGDSITQRGDDPAMEGWAASLRYFYIRRADVVNRGHGGYNSRWGLYVLKELLKRPSYDDLILSTIWWGANDSVLPEMNPKQFVPVEEYEQNLQEMVDLLLGRVATSKIIMITPPPVDGPKWMEWLAENRTGAWGADPPDRETSNTMLYADAVRRVAARNEVALVDLWEGKSKLDPARHLSDGLHLNSAGNKLVYDAIKATLEALYQEILPKDKHQPMIFMHQSKIDPFNYESTILP